MNKTTNKLDREGEWKIEKFRQIRAVDGVPATEKIAIVPVLGDSLEGSKVFDGDLLVFRLSDEPREGRIHVFKTPDGLTAKFFSRHPDGSWILFGSNTMYTPRTYQKDEVQVVGVVVRVERDL